MAEQQTPQGGGPPEPKDFYWIRTANFTQLRAGLIKAEEAGDEEMAKRIRKAMQDINRATPKKPKTLMTVGS